MADSVENVFKKVYGLFDYAPDPTDTWISRHDHVQRGERFKGDCDTFAFTVRDALREQGYQPEVWRVETSPMAGKIPHAVVVVDGKVLDNRYPGVRSKDQATKGSMYNWVEPIRSVNIGDKK